MKCLLVLRISQIYQSLEEQVCSQKLRQCLRDFPWRENCYGQLVDGPGYSPAGSLSNWNTTSITWKQATKNTCILVRPCYILAAPSWTSSSMFRKSCLGYKLQEHTCSKPWLHPESSFSSSEGQRWLWYNIIQECLLHQVIYEQNLILQMHILKPELFGFQKLTITFCKSTWHILVLPSCKSTTISL